VDRSLEAPSLATGAAFMVHVVTDIFRGPNYTEIWLLSLYLMALAIGIAFRTVAFPLTLILLSDMGAEDLAFFLLKRMPIPAQLPGLYSHRLILLQPATPLSLYVGTAIAILIGTVMVYVELRVKAHA
jgi:hypothetical protein